MAEYLAPDVYVEEVDTGSKPIEGVSTSTVGTVGVTERGPADVPILITSFAEYRRWFGEMLNPDLYGDHRFLPHAIDGFFTNGGKRVYVTRVLPAGAAANAETQLFRHQEIGVGSTLLARSPVGANAVVLTEQAAIPPASWVRIGTGSDAEYRQTGAMVNPSAHVAVFRLPLQFSHAAQLGIVELIPPGMPAAPALALVGNHPAGAQTLMVTGGAVTPGQVLQINDLTAPAGNEELILVRSVADLGGGLQSITLEAPLQLDHLGAEVVFSHAVNFGPANPPEDLTQAAVAGDAVVLMSSNTGVAPGGVIRILDGTRTEVRRIGELHRIALGVPTPVSVAAGSPIEHVVPTDAPGITLKTLDEQVPAGAVVLDVNDRDGLFVGQVLRVGAPNDPDVEYVVIRALPDPSGQTPDAGRIVLETPLVRPHGGTTPASLQIVRVQDVAVPVADQTGTVLHPLAAGETQLLATDALLGVGPAIDDLVRITRPGRAPLHVRIQAHAISIPVDLGVPAPLVFPHVAPQPVVIREPLMDVVALDPGVWGNRLRVAARRETTPLVRTRIRLGDGIQDPTHIRLDSAAGVERGTVLTLSDTAGAPIDAPFKVIAIDRQNGYLLTLDTALPGAAAMGATIISLEFALAVYLLRQPDPAQPVRNTQVLDLEMFRHLSLDPRHSRYVHRIIGTTWTPGAPGAVDDDNQPLRRYDRRSEGQSAYVRVRDLAQDLLEPARTIALQSIRLGPEFLVDLLPDGRREAARRTLTGGDDQIAALTDNDYIGQDDVNPEERTGLHSLRNVEEISIVAAPGRFSPVVQGALITHCEIERFRFAVLDGTAPPNDSIADIQAHRQQFDTKYAAIYHPWLLIPHPYPQGAATPFEYPIPPSGHVVGIYARTDVERGVHKAPANEIVRGIIGLQRKINKGEHEILNPYPENINVIRDFRDDKRGIRVYGGRVITSDSDWKYVNVRRLLIFIEASINRGLQWVVFEPNAEPLWARVRRSISNFLTLVWRNGALEGTKPEEAFFVKCDRTTMTQTDLDQGRLICLVGVAPVKPAEFVIVRIGLWTAHADE